MEIVESIMKYRIQLSKGQVISLVLIQKLESSLLKMSSTEKVRGRENLTVLLYLVFELVKLEDVNSISILIPKLQS